MVERLRLRRLHPTDVLVRVRASGLCHTDLEVISGSVPYPMPVVLGHEAAGIVEEVGHMVSGVKPGDHVVGSWNPACGRCFYCVRDTPILCEACARANHLGSLLDGSSRLSLGRTAIHHFNLISSHAELAVLPEAGAVPIPPDIPFDVACLLGCAVTTAYSAVTNVASVRPSETVLVVGCGAVGLNVVQFARLRGATQIIAIDSNPDRLLRADRFGATHMLVPHQATAQQVIAMTGGRGVDAAFEAAGAHEAIKFSIEATRPGGVIVILGKVPFESRISLRFGSLMGEKRIVRSSYGAARPRRDFRAIADAYLHRQIDLESLITHRLSLSDIHTGFAAMARGDVVRAVLRM